MKSRGFLSARTAQPRLPLRVEFQGSDPEGSPQFHGVVKAHKVTCWNKEVGTVFLCDGVGR